MKLTPARKVIAGLALLALITAAATQLIVGGRAPWLAGAIVLMVGAAFIVFSSFANRAASWTAPLLLAVPALAALWVATRETPWHWSVTAWAAMIALFVCIELLDARDLLFYDRRVAEQRRDPSSPAYGADPYLRPSAHGSDPGTPPSSPSEIAWHEPALRTRLAVLVLAGIAVVASAVWFVNGERIAVAAIAGVVALPVIAAIALVIGRTGAATDAPATLVEEQLVARERDPALASAVDALELLRDHVLRLPDRPWADDPFALDQHGTASAAMLDDAYLVLLFLLAECTARVRDLALRGLDGRWAWDAWLHVVSTLVDGRDYGGAWAVSQVELRAAADVVTNTPSGGAMTLSAFLATVHSDRRVWDVFRPIGIALRSSRDRTNSWEFESALRRLTGDLAGPLRTAQRMQ